MRCGVFYVGAILGAGSDLVVEELQVDYRQLREGSVDLVILVVLRIHDVLALVHTCAGVDIGIIKVLF